MMKARTLIFAFALVVALGSGFLAGRAQAAQNHMNSALDHLRSARTELNLALADKGGHREKAIGLVNDAITEVEAGMAYARRR